MLYASFVFYPRWKQPAANAAIAWDVSGYYWYLPALFIYKDLKHQDFHDSILRKYQPTGTDFQQVYQHPSGSYVMKYSSGMAVMYLPFFAVAHVLANPLGFPADGFSIPYQLAIQIGGLLVALLGLWYFRKLLLLFYDDTVTAICLFLLVVGTNFLNYGAIDTGMSHAWLFTVYIFILLNTVYFYRKPTYRYAINIGLLCGLATLTRPTEIISFLLPLLWGLEKLTGAAIRRQWKFVVLHYRQILVCTLCGAAVFSIQLFYWKYASGEWLVYSYGDQKFDWLNPHFYKYLITSSDNGWLAFTPIMVLSFIGFYFFIKSSTHYLAVGCFFFVNLYLVCCWPFYFYGGRFMVQSYPVLFLPIASFVSWTLKGSIRSLVLFPTMALAAYVSLWTTIQLHYGGLYQFRMTPKYYLNVVGRWKVSEEVQKLKDTDELFRGAPQGLRLVYSNSYKKDTANDCSHSPIDGITSICLNKDQNSYSESFPYTAAAGAEWLRAEATIHSLRREGNEDRMTQFVVQFLRDGQEIKRRMIKVYRFIGDNETKRLYIDVKVPDEKFDRLKIDFLHMDSPETLLIDDLKVWEFKE
jgi:hypothetical protein